MKCFFSSSKNLKLNLHGIGPSSSLQMFLCSCCLIQEKKFITQPNLTFLNKFSDIYIFLAGIKSNILSYFAPSSSIPFRVFCSLCFLHSLHIFSVFLFGLFPTPLSIASILLIMSQILKEINRFHLLNLFKTMSPELQLPAKSIHIDKKNNSFKNALIFQNNISSSKHPRTFVSKHNLKKKQLFKFEKSNKICDIDLNESPC